jgi:hypothetical protein
LFGTKGLWKALDQMRQEMAEHADRQKQESDSIIATTESLAFALSAVILGVLLRSGSLIAMLVSALPLWRGFDPLAVLTLSDEERRKREKELSTAKAEEDRSERGIGRLLDARGSARSETND